jgi:multiple sugar transport system permease protein
VLLFPFYWMALTAIKPDEQAARSREIQSVLDLESDAQAYPEAAVRTYYPLWLWNTMLVAVCATILSIVASVLAAYAIVRPALPRRAVGRRRDLPRLSVPPSILFIPLSSVVFQYGCSTRRSP